MNDNDSSLQDKIRRIIQIPGERKIFEDDVNQVGLINRDIYRSNEFATVSQYNTFYGITCVTVDLCGKKEDEKDPKEIYPYSWWINKPFSDYNLYVETTAPGFNKFVGVFSPNCQIKIIEGRAIKLDPSSFLFCQTYQDYGIFIKAEKMTPLIIPIWIKTNLKALINTKHIIFNEPERTKSLIYKMPLWAQKELTSLALKNPYTSMIYDDRYYGTDILSGLIRPCRFHWIANTICNQLNLYLFYFDGISYRTNIGYWNRTKITEFRRGFYMLSNPI